MGLTWLFHIDDDELLYFREPFERIVSRLPDVRARACHPRATPPHRRTAAAPPHSHTLAHGARALPSRTPSTCLATSGRQRGDRARR